ncbi:MAG: AI-2E family transporter [Verrucomicrobiota bacterium]
MDRTSSFSSGLNHPLVWIGVIVGTLISLYVMHAIWWLSLPLVLSIIICYVSKPFLQELRRRGLTQGQSLFTYLLIGSFLILVCILIVLPWVASQIYELREQVPMYWEQVHAFLENTAKDLEKRFPGFREAGLMSLVERQLDTSEEMLVSKILPDLAIYVISWIPPLLLIPYLAFFILKDGVQFKRLILRGVPNAYFEKVLLLFHNLDTQVKQYFRGLFAMTFLDTITLGIGLYLIGMPLGLFGIGQSLFLGLVCAILAWVPYLGTATGCLMMVIVCLSQAPGNWLLVLASVCLFVAVRVIDDFFYTPMTIGKSLSSHPLLTVLIVFAAGYIGGVIGLLLAMPVLGIWMALGEVFGQVWMDERLRARHRATRQLRRTHAQKGLL